jgi:hypothetical protein
MISGCTDSQTSADTYDRNAVRANRCNDLRFSGYHRARAQGPGKCLPSDYVYADFAEGTPYVPDTSAGTSFQPKATPLAFCSRLNLITSVCKSDVLLVQKQPPPSTKIKLKETTENAVRETVSFTMTSGGSVSALSYTTKSISLLPSPIL